MLTLKLTKIGAAIGLVLPPEMAYRLRTKEGQEVCAIEIPEGYLLTTLNPSVQEQVKFGEDFMGRYRDVLADLARR